MATNVSSSQLTANFKEAYASDLKVLYPDVAKLQKDMDDPKLKQIIERNMALASALGVRGTPAFVVGTQFVPGAVDADALKQLIADARKRS